MISLALIGRDISHSQSQVMYEEILGRPIHYELIDCANESSIPTVDELCSQFDGISITSPYKRHFLDHVKTTSVASKIGAINCLVKKNDGIYGTNTDYLAAREIIGRYIEEGVYAGVVILGSGAMGTMTRGLVEEFEFPIVQINRKDFPDMSSADLARYFSSGNRIIINTCSREFVFQGQLGSGDLFWDMNYSFEPHDYISAKNRYIDGLELLKLQAKYALKEWKIL